MQTIKSLDGHRWFIWALVIIVASGVALVSYIQATDVDATSPDLRLNHKAPVQQEQQAKKPATTKASTVK